MIIIYMLVIKVVVILHCAQCASSSISSNAGDEGCGDLASPIIVMRVVVILHDYHPSHLYAVDEGGGDLARLSLC